MNEGELAVTFGVGEEFEVLVGEHRIVIRLTWVGEEEATVVVEER